MFVDFVDFFFFKTNPPRWSRRRGFNLQHLQRKPLEAQKKRMKMDPLPSENVLPKEDGFFVFFWARKKTLFFGGYITVKDRVMLRSPNMAGWKINQFDGVYQEEWWNSMGMLV